MTQRMQEIGRRSAEDFARIQKEGKKPLPVWMGAHRGGNRRHLQRIEDHQLILKGRERFLCGKVFRQRV